MQCDAEGRSCARVYLKVDSNDSLSGALVTAVNEACDQIQDAAENVILVAHVGSQNEGEDRLTPGDMSINLVSRWERALRRVERLGAMTIAVVKGRCAGPALEMLLATDYRIGTRDARLGLQATPGEIWPSMAVYRLANQVGIARARRLVLFGTQVSATKALELGVLDEISDNVADVLMIAVQLVSGLEGTELAIRRRLLSDATTTSFEEALGAHLAACDRTLRRIRQRHQPTPACPDKNIAEET